MIVKFDKKFKKQLIKAGAKLQDQFERRLALFLEDPTSPQLRVHPLKGAYHGYWSLNVNGDVRALYYYEGDAIVVFALIGTHSQLY